MNAMEMFEELEVHSKLPSNVVENSPLRISVRPGHYTGCDLVNFRTTLSFAIKFITFRWQIFPQDVLYLFKSAIFSKLLKHKKERF